MPKRLKHSCKYPLCPKLIEGTDRYCPAHKAKVYKDYDLNRETSTQRGYDKRWQAIRAQVLKDDPFCGCGEIATRVHHKDHDSHNHSSNNLISICKKCHEKIHGGLFS